MRQPVCALTLQSGKQWPNALHWVFAGHSQVVLAPVGSQSSEHMPPGKKS